MDNKTSSRFDTRQSDLNRVDSINNFRTESYMQLRTVMFDNSANNIDFANSAIDFLNGLKGFYRVVKEHADEPDQEDEIEDMLDEVESSLYNMKVEHRIERDWQDLKQIEEKLTDVEDKINDVRRSAGLSISQTDSTPEGEELL
jgi:RNA processing factor Prp31